MKNPCDVIKLNEYTHKVDMPELLLLNTSCEKKHGKIPDKFFTKFNMSLAANSKDEISFDVHKMANGVQCPIWDKLIDLKVVELMDFARYQISVDYTDNTETIKSIHGVSLETELEHLYLNNFHVNDDEEMDMEITEYSQSKYENGEYVPTTFFNENKPERSLMHRVLKDKAPHWSLGHMPTYISVDKTKDAELASAFWRVFTVDGQSIYDFLVNTVAEEANVVFQFDTLHRIINCYNLEECYIYNQDGTKIDVSSMIGEDTNVLISKKKLAKEISISSNKDEIKNCFRVEGGDDLITAMVAAINMNGTNYIYKFSDFQLDDMSDELREKITSYQTMMENDSASYYGENGIYMRLCNAYEEKLYKESGMMPEITIEVGTAQDEYNKLLSNLQNATVAVSQLNRYSSTLFAGVNNNIEAYANILIDSRFDLEIYGDPTYTKVSDDKYVWSGKFRIKQHTDETNVYPIDMDNAQMFTIYVNEDELTFAKQKCDKALYKVDLSTMDTDTYNMNDSELKSYLEQYCLASLKSFYDGLDTCISTLLELGSDEEDSPTKVLYNKYYNRRKITEEIYKQRQEEVNALIKLIETIEKEQMDFQDEHDFKKYLGDKLYLEFCTYRREDTYTNNNYISDSIDDDTAACLDKAKELIEVATKEINKACMLQHTVSTSINNLLVLPEFESLYDKFALYNYIRVNTDDEVLKLRLIGIDFNGDDWSDISVTFSDQIEYVDGAIDTTTAILKQASSMSSSYSATTLQAKQGSEAKSIFNEIYANGLNATNAMLKNSDNNEVTISASGIVAKRMDDEGFYGDKQLRVIGNCVAMTNNNWKTVSMAIGEITFTDPITKVTSQKYGVIADAIVGNMIVGQNMVIGNDKGTVSINSDGIVIYDGQDVTDENKVFYADNTGNLHLKAHIEANSGKIANFNISENALYTDDAVFGSSGLYFGSSGLSLGSGFKVDTNGNITSSGILSIADGNLTYSSTNGLVVKGNIQATSGKVANFNINTSALYTDGATFTNATGIYFGSSGLRIGSGFKVDTSGNITSSGTLSMAGGNLTYSSANGLVVKGKIQATSGSFRGDLYANGAIYMYNTYHNTPFKLVEFYFGSSDDETIYFRDMDGYQFMTIAPAAGNTFQGDITGTARYAQHLTYKAKGTDGTERYPIGTTDSTSGYQIAYINSKAQNSAGNYYITVNGRWETSSYSSHNIVSSSSDIRLKDNVKDTDVNNALYFISQIKVRQFDWKHSKCHQKIGFVADELEELDSSLSVGGGYEEDGSVNYKTVDGFYLQGYEIKAIQELYQIIQSQQKEIKELKQIIAQ